jgi:tRNA-splicing ligase RtcB
MAIELDGEYTTARVLVDDEGLVGEECLDQIRAMTNHPAFTEPIRVMPDAHWGMGAPVGFAMPLPDAVVPNVVGVDVGCGMAATNLGPRLPLEDAERERRVREAVPMGFDVRDPDDAVHLVDEFPFERANDVFERFAGRFYERFGAEIDPIEFAFDGYDADYFDDLCERVLADQRQGQSYVIRGAGTLGGGNHFVEFARAADGGDYWLVIHSGSRYLGKAVAEYWQNRATDRRSVDEIRERIPAEYAEFLKFDPDSVADRDLYEWVTGGKGESYVRKDAVRRELDGKEIEHAFDALGDLAPRGDGTDDRNTDLDHLEGREAHGYYVDMLFAQQYARWNRELMSDAVCEALGVDPVERIESIHNHIDFEDLTIRKGATPAREGQRLIVPLNMASGSLLARGKGNPEYHQTAPHGAGRTMGRRDAHERLSVEEFEAAMDGVYSESVGESTIDEAPMAYKPADAIEAALAPTAAVVDRLRPVHNLKATD